ncbi:MAG: phosphate transporter, inner rane subunit PstA [Deltaproteobacteria bacterium]|nr:phosphate transporter, inner rane subunit PstA [Deltaproteobacteria bacterium]
MRVNPRIINRFVRWGLNAQAYFTVGILVVIIGIIFFKGFPQVNFAFIFSFPQDMGRHGGIFPAIVGTIQLALLSILLATPLGVGTAIFLTEYTRESVFTKLIRFGVESLAGIPSILYGLFGFIFFVIKLKMGWSLLAGVLTLTIMILPTIIRTSEEAIRAVPRQLRIVSYSLSASKWETIKKVVLPAAMPGILTGIMLSIGRAVGETAAIIFTMGSSLRLPLSLMESGRTMAVHFYILAREGISMEKAYGTAVVLVLSILIINILAYYIMHKAIARYS